VDVFQDIVASAVEKVLPDMLRKELPSILQDMLPELFADLSSPSLPPTPRSSQIAKAHTRTPGHKPTLAAVFRAVISTHTETHLERIFTDAVDQASELYNSADNEVNECLSDARLEFATLQEDHITAFNDDCNEKLTEFKERLVEDKDEVEAHADEVVLRAYDRLNMVGNKMCCRCKCHHGAKDKQSGLEQGRRAMSLPP
jgi:cell division septum initiation protein DivIVA